MPRPVDVILFDAGGTLLGTNTASPTWYQDFFVDACREQGREVPVEEVSAILREASASCTVRRRSSSPEAVRRYWEHVYGETFRRLLPGSDARAIANHYIDRFEAGEFVELFSDTVPALQSLKQHGLRFGVVSNFGTYLADFLDRTGISNYFDFAIISAAEGCEKPEPEIFERALRNAAVSPDRVMFVGDHVEEDYAASSRHGCIPVLVDRHNLHEGKPMTRVRALTELARLIG